MITLASGNTIFKQDADRELTIRNQSFYLVKTNLRGTFNYLNPLFCSVMEIEPSDWVGKRVWRFLYPGDQAACKAAAKRLVADPDHAQKIILRTQTASGILSTQWDLILLRGEKQQPAEILCIGHDITTLIRKQESLQQLLDLTNIQNKRLEEFTYIVSHNIRSHVANLSGIVHSVDMNDEDDRNYSMDLLKISIGALDNTVHYLNEIVSIQATKELPVSAIDINEEVVNALQLLGSLVEESKATVYSRIPPGTLLNTNPPYFESILLNLLTNAIRSGCAGSIPEITIAVTNQEGYKVLSIKDNGPGLDLKAMKDQLFGVFNIFSSNRDATGMKLYITRTQIEAMGGKIEVESQPGSGSTFYVHFPILRIIK